MRVFRWLLILPLMILARQALADTTVTLATDYEKQGGFLLEITNEAFKRVGYKVDVTFEPWSRAMRSAYSGTVDGLLGCLYSDRRAQKLVYSEMIAQSPYVVFTLKTSTIAYRTISDLRSYRVGLILDSTYPDDLSNDPNIKKEYVPHYEQNIKKLLLGRIDAFVEKKFVVLDYLKNHDQENSTRVVALDPPLLMNKFYNAFSRANPNSAQLRQDFDLGLARLKDDGGYAAIMAKGLHE
ncbi:transporter substrate-binding domain-containing protein [Telmatospirillum sp.]|uniref:substrate-binding periplasmic protein n=1 Tax=Telmatospirillum sp. TaxID=2079197 RepID=UPI0028516D19|nr:transporter substrate-binding domain-containing protein [Telmatospirillum sp.]MDR3437497.1 transporter substrate-binding domain-containing protein [Telmatospirillum sp.]